MMQARIGIFIGITAVVTVTALDPAIEEVVEFDGAGDRDQAAAVPVMNTEQGVVYDGDNIETQVADEIVKQTLNAVVLLDRDPDTPS